MKNDFLMDSDYKSVGTVTMMPFRSALPLLLNPSNLRISPGIHWMKIIFAVLALGAASIAGLQAADFYWDADGAGAGTGGTGNWAAVDFWRDGSDIGTLGSWGTGNKAILAGTAGTVTLGASGSGNFTPSGISVTTNGYTITSSSSERNLVAAGSLDLSGNVSLILDLNNSNGTWGFGSISFGAGSSITLQGKATANNANRVNLSAAGTISGGSLTLAGTAAGPSGFVSTVSGGVALNTDILNNSATSATLLGANNNTLFTYGGVLSGSANLQISAGQAGGAGTVVLGAANLYSGNTYLNSNAAGVLRVATNNALPTGTIVYFAQSAGGGTADSGGTLDLNGYHQTVAALDGNGRGIVNTTLTPSTLTIGKSSGSNTFGGVIGKPADTTNIGSASNAISLVKLGASTQILTGNNTYSGPTTIEGGALVINGAQSGNGLITVRNGGALGGTGGTAGNLHFDLGAKFLFNATNPFSVGGSSVTFDGFGVADLLGLNSSVASGSYTLIDGAANVSLANVLNTSLESAYYLGDGRSAYFQSGSLVLVVVPEPGSALLGFLGFFVLLRRRRN